MKIQVTIDGKEVAQLEVELGTDAEQIAKLSAENESLRRALADSERVSEDRAAVIECRASRVARG
jgi:Ni,Fe-hydrogenase III large subunit